MAKTFQDLLNEGQAKVLGIVSIVPMDDWNTDTQYQKLNLVRHNGAAYLAKGGSKNVEPGVTQDWQSSWMLVYLDGILSPDGTYPNLTAGRVMHALAWGNKNYDGSSAQTITAADLGLADVYKPQGSIAFASLPATPNESNYGYVWNITNDFTTDSRFIEGAGKKYSAGTNVGVIEQDSAYYYDIFGAFVDLSNYATVEALNAEITRAKAAEQANAIAASKAQSTANSKYTKPSSGIPKSDLAQSVQDSLDKADSALQSAPVTSVNGETGAVSLSASDVGAATSAQGEKADQAATDIANIKNGTTVVGRAINVTSQINGHAISDIFETDGTTVKEATQAEVADRVGSIVIQDNADLNDCTANINEVQVYTCPTNATAATLLNCPVDITFTMWTTCAFEELSNGSRDFQFLIAINSKCYYRVRRGGTTWANWRTLVESDGSYPNLGAGYLAKNGIMNASQTSQIGWWKIFSVPISALTSISVASTYSILMEVNGVYAEDEGSGSIEVNGRSNSSLWAEANCRILSGNLTPNNFAVVVSSDGTNLEFYAYAERQYTRLAFTVTSEYYSASAVNAINWTVSFSATSAPTNAVYAVNRSQADYNSAGAALVDVASAQQISGAKTFTGNNIVKAHFSRTAGAGNYKYFDYLDSNDNRMGVIGVSATSNNYYGTYMQAGNEGSIGIYSNGSDVYTSAPTPDANSNTNEIATTEWVRDYFNVSNNRSDLDAVFSATFTGTSGIRSLGESYYDHPFFAIKWKKINSSGQAYTTTLFIPTDMITQGSTTTYFSLADTEDYLNWWFNSSSSFQFESSKNSQLTIYFYDFNF